MPRSARFRSGTLVALVLLIVPGGLIVWQHTTSSRRPPVGVDPLTTITTPATKPAPPDAEENPAALAEPVRAPRPAPVVVRSPDPGRSPLADKLNAPDGDIRADLAILVRVFDNFRQELGANPVGNNREITAQLSGKNKHRHAPLPSHHPAVNAAGQLADRWGTPFFFHAISSLKMEIRSAGPDRELYTDDDAVW